MSGFSGTRFYNSVCFNLFTFLCKTWRLSFSHKWQVQSCAGQEQTSIVAASLCLQWQCHVKKMEFLSPLPCLEALTFSLLPLLWCSLSLISGGIKVLFSSTLIVSYFQHIKQPWVCIHYRSLLREAFPTEAESSIYLWVYAKCLEGKFGDMSIQLYNCSKFLADPLKHRSLAIPS